MSLSHRLGLLGRKVGMMRIFTDDGDAVPVTVLDVSNNRVTQVKTESTDGYSAIQVAFDASHSHCPASDPIVLPTESSVKRAFASFGVRPCLAKTGSRSPRVAMKKSNHVPQASSARAAFPVRRRSGGMGTS